MTDILDDLLGPGAPEPQPAGPVPCCDAPPVRSCTACHRPTCREHLWTMLGVCVSCAAEDRFARFQRQAEPEGGNWLEGA